MNLAAVDLARVDPRGGGLLFGGTTHHDDVLVVVGVLAEVNVARLLAMEQRANLETVR